MFNFYCECYILVNAQIYVFCISLSSLKGTHSFYLFHFIVFVIVIAMVLLYLECILLNKKYNINTIKSDLN